MQLDAFHDIGLDNASLARLLSDHDATTLPRLERFWAYYRNEMTPRSSTTRWAAWGRNGSCDSTSRAYRLAQEAGLPERYCGSIDDRAGPRREVVIENDIAWRVQSMIDFLLGKPLRITSTARDEKLRDTITRVLDRVWERSGGIALLQDMALLGHVYGYVDLLVRVGDNLRGGGSASGTLDRALAAAEEIRIEVIEPTRGIALLNTGDYREIDAYVLRLTSEPPAAKPGAQPPPQRLEIISRDAWQVFDGDTLAAEHPLPAPGVLPVVHIQNIAQPFEYPGMSEVEPLIPLQDELNTRLSDRAQRVTFQSFRMWLAKGIDGFDKGPVGPGAVWSTDNPDASITVFGGDADSPSETAHIREIRDALDKISTVPPIASGVVQAKIGNLSSANALRITLMGVLAKTARKQVTYGAGLSRVCEIVLAALDHAGVLPTQTADRGVRLTWPDPLPEDPRDQAAAAESKVRLGVPAAVLRDELGYEPTDPGITG
ncbi:MAG: phage portal protein [Tepidisphaera sp.]|nr:phage portal protein [Tepidisphaera sp.]